MKPAGLSFDCPFLNSAILAISEISGMNSAEFRIYTIHNLEDGGLIIPVPTRRALSAHAPLLFLVVCVCSLFFNAGQPSENSSQRVLIVLDSILLLRCMQTGNSSG